MYGWHVVQDDLPFDLQHDVRDNLGYNAETAARADQLHPVLLRRGHFLRDGSRASLPSTLVVQ